MIASDLANHLWQSTLVAGLAWLVTLALRRDRARVRFAVWLAASLKFLLPLSALTSVGSRFGWRPIVVASFTPYDVMLDAAGGPLRPTAVRFAAHQSPPLSLLRGIGGVLPEALIGLWALGAIALLAIWIVRWRRVAAIMRSSMPLEAGPVFDVLRRLERRTGIRRPIALVLSQSSLEPGIVGFLRPTLVWPARMDQHLSLEQIDAIVAHEVEHVRRRDNLAAALHMCVQAAFWFHPMVWWIGARLVDERERACDEAVVGAGSERYVYAEGILKTCQLLMESPLPCVSGVTGADLKKRIEHIMTNNLRPDLNAWKKCLLAAAASAALAVPFVVGIISVRPIYAQQAAGADRPAAPAGGNATAAFDVTSVKPNDTGSGMIRMIPAANGGFRAENATVGMLIRMASQLQDNQIVGGPKWLFEDRFDIVGSGTAPGKAGPPFEKMKSLLADRFKLVTHMEKREQSMYALVLARRDGKLGEKMTPSTADCSPAGPNGRGPGAAAPPAPGQRPQCGFSIGPGRLLIGGQTMAAIAQNLSRFVGGIVVDKTSLTGTYDVELSFAPDPGINPLGRDLPPQPGGAPPAANSDEPSIFSAVQEQLGLKLESTKGPVDVLVIDSVEKPTAD